MEDQPNDILDQIEKNFEWQDYFIHDLTSIKNNDIIKKVKIIIFLCLEFPIGKEIK